MLRGSGSLLRTQHHKHHRLEGVSHMCTALAVCCGCQGRHHCCHTYKAVAAFCAGPPPTMPAHPAVHPTTPSSRTGGAAPAAGWQPPPRCCCCWRRRPCCTAAPRWPPHSRRAPRRSSATARRSLRCCTSSRLPPFARAPRRRWCARTAATSLRRRPTPPPPLKRRWRVALAAWRWMWHAPGTASWRCCTPGSWRTCCAWRAGRRGRRGAGRTLRRCRWLGPGVEGRACCFIRGACPLEWWRGRLWC